MRDIAPYDAAVAECAQDRMTDSMIAAVNRHHLEARKAAAMLHTVAALQKAQAAQIAQHTRREANLYTRNKQLEKKVRRQRRIGMISLDLLLLAGSRAALLAMRAGLISFNLALPLALAATLYGGWLLRSLWHEFRRFR